MIPDTFKMLLHYFNIKLLFFLISGFFVFIREKKVKILIKVLLSIIIIVKLKEC